MALSIDGTEFRVCFFYEAGLSFWIVKASGAIKLEWVQAEMIHRLLIFFTLTYTKSESAYVTILF